MYGFYHSHWADSSHAFRRSFRHPRGGSRLLWFVLGAGTATWFLHRPSSSADDRRGCTWRHRRELDAVREGISGHAPSPNVAPPPPPLSSSADGGDYRYQYRFRFGTGAPDASPQGAPGPAPAQPPSPPPPHAALAAPWPADRWQAQHQQWMTDKMADAGRAREAESEAQARMRELAKVAETKVTELSEATLDSILSTVNDLKSKLAQHKAAQERLLREEQQRVEEEKRNPQRWV